MDKNSNCLADQFAGFDYTHNNKIILHTSIGEIELMYKVNKEVEADGRAHWGKLWEGLPSSNPDENQHSWFQATLLKDGRGVMTETAIMPDKAVERIYCRLAYFQFEKEWNPSSSEID